MTDRLKGFVVVLDQDYRVDDAEEIRIALSMVKGVLSVTPSVTQLEDHMNRQRIRTELHEKLFEVLRDPTRKA
jgi:hypothetical protein